MLKFGREEGVLSRMVICSKTKR